MATKKIEICIVRMGKHSLNNDYVIYNDGKYERVYDRSAYALNLLERSACQELCPRKPGALEELFSKHPPAPDG